MKTIELVHPTLKIPLGKKMQFYPPSASSVLYLPGYPPGGSIIYDKSLQAEAGAPNNGTIYGATWVRLPSGLWVLSFDGVNDYVDWGDNKNLGFATGNFAISFWFIRSETWGDYHQMLGKPDQTTAVGYTFLTASGVLGIYMKIKGANDAGATNFATYRPTLVTGVYTKVAYSITRSGTTMTVTSYQNGVLLGAQSGTVNGSLENTSEFRIWRSYAAGKVSQLPLLTMNAAELSAAQAANSFNQERHFFGV